MNDFSKILKVFKNLYLIVTSPYLNDDIAAIISNILNSTGNRSIIEELESENHENVNFDEKREAIYKRSPFYRVFCDIIEKVTPCCEGNISNDYYSEAFGEIILKKYIPYLPLWSGIMLDEKEGEVQRVSNAPVESWFGIVKNQILKKETDLKCSRFYF